MSSKMDVPNSADQRSIVSNVLGCCVACTRIGAAHRRAAKPCQDAHALNALGDANVPCLAVAVADGHGDDRHDQSEMGAAFAVRSAIEEMTGFHQHFGIEGSLAALKQSFRADFPRRLGRAWRHTVLEDARARLGLEPASDAETQRCHSRYGTTLLTALIVRGAILLGQIGDGDILFIQHDGTTVVPLPAEESAVGPQTSSIASPNASHLWRTTIVEADQGGDLLLATDGLSTAFADDEQFHTFARSLGSRLREFGPEAVTASLPAWLDSYSEQGSGDDITLAFVAMPAAERPQTLQGPHP